MRTNLILVSILLLFQTAAVAKTTKAQKPAPKNKYGATLGTSFRFDGSSLHGKFQNSPSTTATVEDDKFLEDLLGARKNFADRIDKDRERN